jgi:hypothetical protein
MWLVGQGIQGVEEMCLDKRNSDGASKITINTKGSDSGTKNTDTKITSSRASRVKSTD